MINTLMNGLHLVFHFVRSKMRLRLDVSHDGIPVE